MKYPKIIKSQGLINSEEVLKRLKKRKDLADYEIWIGAFTNCREVGLTFYPIYKNGEPIKKSKTFCIYEHRNSDQIIINGKNGCITFNGDLPYQDGDKWNFLACADYEKYDEATDLLVKEIKKLN